MLLDGVDPENAWTVWAWAHHSGAWHPVAPILAATSQTAARQAAEAMMKRFGLQSGARGPTFGYFSSDNPIWYGWHPPGYPQRFETRRPFWRVFAVLERGERPSFWNWSGRQPALATWGYAPAMPWDTQGDKPGAVAEALAAQGFVHRGAPITSSSYYAEQLGGAAHSDALGRSFAGPAPVYV